MADDKRRKAKDLKLQHAVSLNRLDKFLEAYVPDQHKQEIVHRIDRLEKLWSAY